MRRALLFVLLVSFPLASRACLNDRDSDADALADANARFPDALRVITGRFERNPPRFYRMRIERVGAELRAHPHRFGLYDDLAVAHDRLGDDNSALKIMAHKRAELQPFNARGKANREAWYRFFANDGTFRAHRFLKGGAKVQNIGEMKRAWEEIKRAIEIKPNAHFGRERVQLMVMDWVLATKKGKANKTLGNWIEDHDHELNPSENYDQEEARQRQTAQGLTGLIVLGAAWQSSDVFEALALTLDEEPTLALRYLALLRCRELIQNGRPSLAGLSAKQVRDEAATNGEGSGVGINMVNARTLDGLYPKLRAEAEAWNASRGKWMEAKFAQGQHPDTNPTFWQGWQEPPAPQLAKVRWWNEHESRFEDEPTRRSWWFLAPIFGSLGLSLWVLGRKRRARRKIPSA